MVFRNQTWGCKLPRAYITRFNNIVRIRITVLRPVEIKAGQYINLWIPSVSWYIFQSHPFVVTNWAEGKQGILELFIQLRGGLTCELFSYGMLDMYDSVPRRAFFSGPYGISIPVMEYETILMVATGFGIAAQLPYLRKLIYGY
jgi:NAD(P)H-flavin reductase